MRAKKSLFLLLALSLCVGCSKTPLPTLPVYYDENPEYTPDRIGEWETLLCIFTDGECREVLQPSSMSQTPELSVSPGERVSGVVFASQDNLSLGAVQPGNTAASYWLRRSSEDPCVPEIWAFSSVVKEGGEAVDAPLRPVTSCISVSVSAAPEEFSGVSLSLPYSCDTYFLEQAVLESSGDRSKVQLDYSRGGGAFTLLPMKEDAMWTLSLDLLLEELIRLEIPLERGLTRGRNLSVSLDLSRYRKEGVVSAKAVLYDPVTHRDLCTGTASHSPEVAPPAMVSDHYRVWFQDAENQWVEAGVRDALCSDAARYHGSIWNDWDNSKRLRDTMAFSIFEHPFDRPVKVRIKKYGPGFSSVKVRPSDYGIAAVPVGDNTVELTLPTYERRKVSVEFDGDRFHNLFLLPGRPDPDKPDPADPNVVYFGPGEHDAGRITLRSSQTLYIDYGATVYGEVLVAGDDCTLAGHGVLSGERLRHWGETWSMGDILVDCNPYRKPERTRLTVKDLTFIDSPSWTLSVYNYDGVTIDGINMICWTLNGDGVDVVSSRNVEVRNCFLRCYDDCITLKVRHNADPVSDLCDVHVHDNVCWNDYARGIVVGIEAGNVKYGTGSIHDVLIEDCILLENARSGGLDDLRGAFAIGQYASPDWSWAQGTACDMERITARNIRFDNLSPTARCVFLMQYPDMDESCKMSDVTLENFQISNALGNRYPFLTILTNQHAVEGLKIINFTVDGTRITSRSDAGVSISGNVDVEFK